MRLNVILPAAALVLAAIAAPALAQSPGAATAITVHLKPRPHYVRPFEPFRIVGNVYYVGTYDLAVYLITTPQGHMLINTGINDSAPVIKENVEKVSFEFSAIKLLLATHGHWDHVGAFSEIKRMTGAKMLMHEDDAGMLESGGSEDYRYPQGRGVVYEPVKVDRRLREGDTVRLGDMELTVLHHPGHTLGSTSFSFTVRDAGRDYNVLLANMASINPGVTVGGMPGFTDITAAYTSTLARQKQMRPDIWLASHAAQFNMHAKHKPGDPYDPSRFIDPDGYSAKVAHYGKLFRERAHARGPGVPSVRRPPHRALEVRTAIRAWPRGGRRSPSLREPRPRNEHSAGTLQGATGSDAARTPSGAKRQRHRHRRAQIITPRRARSKRVHDRSPSPSRAPRDRHPRRPGGPPPTR